MGQRREGCQSCVLVIEPPDGRTFELVQGILAKLKEKKPEFQGVECECFNDFKNRNISDKCSIILCHKEFLYELLSKFGSGPLIPVIAVLRNYTAQAIDEIFGYGYPALQGFFLEGTEDPEEIGYLTRIIKDAVRRHLARQGVRLTKSLGWKVKSDFSDPQRRPLVSLFLDAPMRKFMEELVSILNTSAVRMPRLQELPEEATLRDIFHSIAKSREGAATSSPEMDAKRILCQKNEEFSRSTLWFQPILLEGETGSGKTVVAQWAHNYLTRRLSRQIPFRHIPILNVGASLLEGELFGVIPGTFTGALPKVGGLLLAMGGVAFIDEIGDLPLEVQAKLLAYLDTMEFEPQGWDYGWRVFCPTFVIAATNRDLRRAMREGSFREDLYYRFRHRLRIPPLRERKGDLRAHIDLILQDPTINPDRRIREVSLTALARLEGYDYPGNFRELESILSRAVFRARRDGRSVLLPEDIEFPG